MLYFASQDYRKFPHPLNTLSFLRTVFWSNSYLNLKRQTVLWRPTRPSRTNTQKRCPFHHRGLEWKSRKSRDTWSNRSKTNKFCQENTPVIANTLFQQHKRRLYTWTSPDGQHQNQIDFILSSQRWRSAIQSAKTRQGADCGSDHELLIAKFRLKLKKVG